MTISCFFFFAFSFPRSQLTGGKLRVAWESGRFFLADSEPMNNGNWHWAELKWMGSELWLNTDYGHHEKTVPIESKISGLFPVKISLGGLETAGPNLTALIGCMKVG